MLAVLKIKFLVFLIQNIPKQAVYWKGKKLSKLEIQNKIGNPFILNKKKN